MAKVEQVEDIRETVQLFKIFSDYTRLRIIDKLVTGEYCVQDISDGLHTSQSAISHQLKLLRDLNVVKTRKQGKQVFYSLQDNHVKEIYLMGFSHANECK